MKYYWISFAAPGKGNLGCCIVQAESEKAAHEKTITLGINPGGEVLIVQINSEHPSGKREIEKWGLNRLISKAELLGDGYQSVGEHGEEGRNYNGPRAVVCDHCNDEQVKARQN